MQQSTDERVTVERLFLGERFPGWYVRVVLEGREYTIGPYSEAECERVAARAIDTDLEALWDEFDRVQSISIIRKDALSAEVVAPLRWHAEEEP